MKEKNKDTLSFLDETARKIRQAELDDWVKTKFQLGGWPVRVIDLDTTRKGKEKNATHSFWDGDIFVYLPSQPLWSILLGDFCNLLVSLGSTEIYKPFHPQEIKIVSAHQELSATKCIGSVDVYRKTQLISRVWWRLELLDDEVKLGVTHPIALPMPPTLPRSTTPMD